MSSLYDHVAHSVIAKHRSDVMTTPHRSPSQDFTVAWAMARSKTKWDAASPHFAGGATQHEHRPRHPIPTLIGRTDDKVGWIEDETASHCYSERPRETTGMSRSQRHAGSYERTRQ